MTTAFASSQQIPPRVPPEVWLRIFGLATDLDDFLNRDGPISPDLPCTLVKQHELRGLKHSLRTKRSMTLVCRTWNELALEFLYQSILITKVDTLVSLHESLQRHALTAQGKNRLGWRTKRLDVLVADERCEPSDYSMLAAVIRQLPTLSVVTLSMPMLPFNDCWLRQLPTSVIVSLAETCGTSLQVFNCSESALRPCRQACRRLDDAACGVSKFEGT
ncbi:hypothetical protein J3R83DRAFT_11406 [Lanmaoa asiatica]|nr:hypothetical protein J3R83DRAFT_11406 [Lanmaoa asiatica]